MTIRNTTGTEEAAPEPTEDKNQWKPEVLKGPELQLLNALVRTLQLFNFELPGDTELSNHYRSCCVPAQAAESDTVDYFCAVAADSPELALLKKLLKALLSDVLRIEKITQAFIQETLLNLNVPSES